jgi:hypothetical protein
MKKSFFISLAGMVVILAGVTYMVSNPKTSLADPATYTVSGTAFSDMPNTSDQTVSPDNHYGGRGLGSISMSGTGYGVTVGDNGSFSGMAYNALVGTADFSGVSVDAGCLVSNNPCPVTGTFVFTAASDPQSGGWDGQVRMSDASWNDGVIMKAPVNGIRNMAGYAWGGDVVGWVDFSGVQVYIGKDLCTNLPGIDLVVPEGYVKVPAEPADEPGTCEPAEIPGCKIEGDPNYDAAATTENNTMCVCPNGDYNQSTGQCGSGPICPNPAPETNYPAMPGYNALCPIACKNPLKYNSITQRCELDNGDQCPTTKVSNPLNPINGQNDPQTIGIQNQNDGTFPANYTLIGNKCGIPGCGVSYAKNFDGNIQATIDICDYCPKGSKWNTTTQQCETCSDPKAKECNPPKGFISPILKEV